MRPTRNSLLYRTDAGIVLAYPVQRSVALVEAVVAADAAADAEPAAPVEYSILGYRQTEQPAAKGGKANANGFRFRHKAMRKIARTARAQPFITGHNWGDVRARGGTMVDAWADAPEGGAPGELGMFARVRPLKDWAVEGFADGTIDRFSIGAMPEGEVTCTVHDCPVWTECYCWPGMEIDGVVAEWEHENARVVEYSAVNVPAVDGTYVLDQLDPDELDVALADLQLLCGRPHATALTAALRRQQGGAPKGGFTRAVAAITMTSMDPREQMARALGLDPAATWEQINARLAQVTATAAQGEVVRAQLEDSRTELAGARQREAERVAELDAAHVSSEITRLCAARQVSDKVVATLRATAANGRAAFDQSLKLVEDAAPEIVAAAGAPSRPALQSDAKPAIEAAADPGGAEADPYEQHRTNPELPRLMRVCKVTAAHVREHGPRTIPVLPNLRELADATDRRGA